MADVAVDLARAVLPERVGGVDQRAAGIDDVVDQDAGPRLHFADHVHHFRFAGALAALVDDGERRIDALGEPARAHHAADIGRYHRDLMAAEALLDVTHHDGRGEQVVGRNIEEALDLTRVQIDREHAVGARIGDQVRDQLG